MESAPLIRLQRGTAKSRSIVLFLPVSTKAIALTYTQHVGMASVFLIAIIVLSLEGCVYSNNEVLHASGYQSDVFSHSLE